jgi:hypothetical protein
MHNEPMGGTPEPVSVCSRVCPLVVVPLAAAASACGLFSLADVIPLPEDTPQVVGASLGCDAGSTNCECAPPSTIISDDAAVAVAALRIDSNYAYWIAGSGSGRGLFRAPLDGDGVSPTTLIASNPALAPDLAVDDIYAYVVEANDAGPAMLARVPIGGGALEVLPPRPKKVPVDLAVGPEALYWTDENSEICQQPFGAMSTPADAGCGTAPFAPSFAPGNASTGNQLAVAGSNLYIAVNATGEIWQVPVAGADAGVIGQGRPGAIVHLAANGSGAFWAESNGGHGSTIAGSADSGTTTLPLLTVSELEADDANLYYVASVPLTSKPRPQPPPSTPGLGRIWKLPLSGGAEPKVVACGVHAATLVAVDPSGSFVYWADGVSGQVLRAPN